MCNMYTAVEYLLIAVKSQQGYRGNHSISHILGCLKNYIRSMAMSTPIVFYTMCLLPPSTILNPMFVLSFITLF